jgi:acyl transferase domain-containing protein
MDPTRLYEQLTRRGLHYGPAFRCVERLWRRDREALGLLRLPQTLEQHAGAYLAHPALLDAAFQLVAAALPTTLWQATPASLSVPTGLMGLTWHRRLGSPCWGHVFLRQFSAEAVEADIRLLDENGEVVVEVVGLCLQPMHSRSALASPRADRSSGEEATLNRDQLAIAPEPERLATLQSYLRKQVALTLRVAESRLDDNTPLHAFGLDSLMLLSLELRLTHELGTTIKVADFLDGASIATLTPRLLDTIPRGIVTRGS